MAVAITLPNVVWRSLGLSGNKAQHADLTVELGFSSDMGVTNSRYPEEICEGQAQVNQGSMMGLSYAQLDVSINSNYDCFIHLVADYFTNTCFSKISFHDLVPPS